MYDHSKPLIDDEKHPGPLAKLVKIIGGLLALAAAVLIGLSLFIRFYLTEPRLKALIIPQAESALGRTVTLEGIDVGLFSGISVSGLAVKEADKSTDFLSLGRFVLHYKLLPLLSKQLVISEITIDQPACRIIRDATGHFNFETLALLAEKKAGNPASAAKSGGSATAPLPLALTVERISINNATISLRDAKKELPQADLTASARVGVDIGATLADLTLHGDFDFASDAAYGELKPHLEGKGTFTNTTAACTVTVDVDQQRLTLAAAANNLRKKPLPSLRLDISSNKLDLDKLQSLADKLPKTTGTTGATTAAPAKDKSMPIGAGLPPGLDLTGTVKVAESHYQKLTVTDLSLAYTLQNGIVTVSNLSFKTAGGQLAGTARVDLTKTNPPYSGTLDVKALQLQQLLDAWVSPQANILSGAMGADLTFSGTGFTTELIKKNLRLDATYGMQAAQLNETPLSNALAKVLQLDQLRNLALESVGGKLRLNEGKLQLSSQFTGQDIQAKIAGTVGIDDGSLNLPLGLTLSGAMAEQLRQKASFLKYLSSREGATAINLKLAGTTTAPRATLDQAAVEKQIKQQVEEKVKEKIVDEVGRKLLGTPPAQPGEQTGQQPAPAEPVRQLLKGLFGQ